MIETGSLGIIFRNISSFFALMACRTGLTMYIYVNHSCVSGFIASFSPHYNPISRHICTSTVLYIQYCLTLHYSTRKAL